MINEQEFRRHADEALDNLNHALIVAGDEHEFEADLNVGTLIVEFEKPQATHSKH
jgi:frataxin-like iron-binding protein CyaY